MNQIVKNTANWILDHLPGQRTIFFESIPDLSDNTKAVFDEMLRRDIQKKYKMVWWVKNRKAGHPVFPNTCYVDQNTFWNRFLFQWYLMRSKCVISCNYFLSSPRSVVKSFHLTHGTALKSLGGYVLPERMDYVLVAAEGTKEIMARELKGDIKTFYALGFPRNDVLHSANLNLKDLLGEIYQKVVVWYPTFRQNSNGIMTNSVNALPILHDAKKAMALNDAAQKAGILIVVKPHFAQDVSYITDLKLSNIRFINDSFFEKNKISSYEFVGSCDALITDYSSIYFDFLLCKKPVAVIWEDIDDYRQNPGFAIDPEFYMKGAHKIYNLSDFEEFIDSLMRNQDPLSECREEINTLVNFAQDGKNAQRVVDFIVDKAEL